MALAFQYSSAGEAGVWMSPKRKCTGTITRSGASGDLGASGRIPRANGVPAGTLGRGGVSQGKSVARKAVL